MIFSRGLDRSSTVSYTHLNAYPNAKFMWSHRDPAKVMASVCSLIKYVRSWSSDRDDAEELGAEQLASWAEGCLLYTSRCV